VAVEADRDVEGFVLDREGRPLARADYSERRRRWTLNLPRDGRLEPAWSVEAPLDPPYLRGPGRSERTVVVHARRTDLAGAPGEVDDALSDLFEVNVDT